MMYFLCGACIVGRNYAGHAREMGSDSEREPPFFFCKPNDKQSIIAAKAGQPLNLPYPDLTHNYHHEVEWVVAIGKAGKNIPGQEAGKHIFAYAVGWDMTRRDLQAKMREAGLPWEIGKAFDFSAPIGGLHRISETGEMTQACIHLTVNGMVKQRSNINHLIWNVNETISKLSELFE